MTPKQYLKRLRKLEAAIEARLYELRQLEAQKSYITGIRYDGVHVQTSPDGTGFKTSEDIVDLERKVNLLLVALATERHRIIGQIGLLDNPNHVRLLIKRYVEQKSFEQIACDMGYSYDHIMRLHKEALVEFGAKVAIK